VDFPLGVQAQDLKALISAEAGPSAFLRKPAQAQEFPHPALSRERERGSWRSFIFIAINT
jgi:hypothetical protein